MEQVQVDLKAILIAVASQTWRMLQKKGFL
jgi:hypothetical protein